MADFPLGSAESRAAARAMLSKRGAQPAKPEIYRASWVGRPRDEDFEILDINSGLPVGHRCPLAPDRQPEEARLRLARVGIDDVAGYLQGASRHGRTRDFAWNSCRSSACRRCMIVCSSAG